MTLPDPVRGGISHALSLIRARYEHNDDPACNLPFHCVAHTVGVVLRTGALLRAMRVSDDDFHLGLLAAAFHDTVQNWTPATGPDGRVLRRRFTGRNEEDSAAEAVAWMRQAGVFRTEDCSLVTQAILATVPGWDVANLTVSQPHLAHEASPPVRAVALADLSIAGMDGLSFVETADQLFREDNLDIDAALRGCPTRAGLDPAILEGYKARMLSWSRTQPPFARGRRALLEHDLGNLQEPARQAVRDLFSNFETAIALAEDAIRVREPLPPWDLARVMGYAVPDGP